ncbi:hypothetical protein CHL67_04190 [Prosthecochloris sp. GSB1]|nr:PAS domain S-box protein [Prosthecochloris sp. GSB1]ASQ90230.1 hypothetical protein CHL67_04190 [Prosthecochloris sp. GSB1]
MKKRKEKENPSDELQSLRRRIAELQDAEERRRESDQMLAESEKRYRQLFTHMSSGVAVYEAVDDGRDFVFRDFNNAAEKIDKLKRNDVIGKRVSELFPSIEQFGLLDVFRRVWETGRAERYPGTVYEDNRIVGWRENYVYRLSGGEIVAVYDDVTKERQAQEALRESEAYLKSFFCSVPIGIGLVVDRVFVDVNRMFCRTIGYGKRDVIGKSTRMLYADDEEFERITSEMYPRFQKRGGGTFETRVIRKNGRVIDALVCASPVDPRDFSKGYTFAAIDMTERKRAENEIRENREWLRILFGNIRDAVFVYPFLEDGKSGTNAIVNAAACKLLGYNRNALLKMRPSDLLDKEFYSKEGPFVRQELVRKGQVLFDATLVHRKGEKILVEVSAKKVSLGGKTYIISTMRDVRERRRSENELKKISTAISQSPASVVITDIEGTIEYVNPKVTEVTGFSASEVIGKNPRMFQSGRMPPELYKNLWDTICSGREWRGEMLNRKKNGELYWEVATIAPVKDEQGNIINFVAVKEDITEKKRLWEELVEAKEKAEESDRLKSRFFANISHEIRTPMNGILGFSELLKDPGLSAGKKEQYLDLLRHSGQRMLNIINDLIDVSRIEAGEMRILRAETNVNEVIENVHDVFLPQARNAGLFFLFISDCHPRKALSLRTDSVCVRFFPSSCRTRSNLHGKGLLISDTARCAVCSSSMSRIPAWAFLPGCGRKFSAISGRAPWKRRTTMKAQAWDSASARRLSRNSEGRYGWIPSRERGAFFILPCRASARAPSECRQTMLQTWAMSCSGPKSAFSLSTTTRSTACCCRRF